jgi:hypothetical protein
MAKSSTKIFLKDVGSGELREADLFEGIRERHLTDVDEIWQPALTLLERWSSRGHQQQSAHWNWRAKMRHVRRQRNQQSFAIVHRDVTQGLMIIDKSRTARMKPDCGQGLIYVDYVEVAPWNRHGWQPQRVFHSVGSHFLGVAIDLSFQMGFAGRIGLHSLPQADSFYRHHQMTDLGPDVAYDGLRYFELSAAAAEFHGWEDQHEI